MLSVKNLATGDILGAIYDFEKKGDVLPKHVHFEEDIHISIVAKGKIKAYSHDWELGASAGQIIEFRENEPHEIMALEDNTRMVNILKKYRGIVNESRIPETIEV